MTTVNCGATILSLFSRNAYINHFSVLASRFQASDPYARREIFLAAKKNNAVDWLREHKESFESMDPWQRMAFIYCCADLPADEKKYFINRWTFDRPFDIVLAKWARSTYPALERTRKQPRAAQLGLLCVLRNLQCETLLATLLSSSHLWSRLRHTLRTLP